jgi:hypothetical protein
MFLKYDFTQALAICLLTFTFLAKDKLAFSIYEKYNEIVLA